jgi:hypothetical protein
MSRSLDVAQHEAYAPLFEKLMARFNVNDAPQQFSQADAIAAVVYEAATDGKDQLRYLAGEDAKATWAQRQQVGAEEFRKGMAAQFAV